MEWQELVAGGMELGIEGRWGRKKGEGKGEIGGVGKFGVEEQVGQREGCHCCSIPSRRRAVAVAVDVDVVVERKAKGSRGG